jgi:hypothetical protein
MLISQTYTLSLLVSVLTLSGCNTQTGGMKAMLTPSGSAAGETSVNAKKSLLRCRSPLGTLAVSDGRYEGLRNITTVDPLIRLAVQQSNCFVMTSYW